ncbi:putative holliday junction resolvase [Escherichia coli]|uniref:Putative holliday junction resolvase n=1 Tax=Escherichia coli TaxID=562 RepID=A0A377BZL2_ECOLX|nr:putative holliday junction resolvase [Escherichia coli]
MTNVLAPWKPVPVCFEQGGYRALNKGKVDSASAVIILESYFEQGY